MSKSKSPPIDPNEILQDYLGAVAIHGGPNFKMDTLLMACATAQEPIDEKTGKRYIAHIASSQNPQEIQELSKAVRGMTNTRNANVFRDALSAALSPNGHLPDTTVAAHLMAAHPIPESVKVGVNRIIALPEPLLDLVSRYVLAADLILKLRVCSIATPDIRQIVLKPTPFSPAQESSEQFLTAILKQPELFKHLPFLFTNSACKTIATRILAASATGCFAHDTPPLTKKQMQVLYDFGADPHALVYLPPSHPNAIVNSTSDNLVTPLSAAIQYHGLSADGWMSDFFSLIRKNGFDVRRGYMVSIENAVLVSAGSGLGDIRIALDALSAACQKSSGVLSDPSSGILTKLIQSAVKDSPNQTAFLANQVARVVSYGVDPNADAGRPLLAAIQANNPILTAALINLGAMPEASMPAASPSEKETLNELVEARRRIHIDAVTEVLAATHHKSTAAPPATRKKKQSP